MVFFNGILNGTRNNVQWYLNGTWLNGILNGPMIFWMVLIRSSSASSSMVFWMVYHSEYHWRRSCNVSYKYHSEYHWTIQNTIQPSTIQIPLNSIPRTIQIPFKYHSTVYIHRPPKYHWSTIQIPLAIIPPRTIQIPFKYHSTVYIRRPSKYHWSTIQIPFKYHWPLYPLVPFNGIWMVFFCKGKLRKQSHNRHRTELCSDREVTVGDSVRVWDIQRQYLRKECSPRWNSPQPAWKYFQDRNISYGTETFAAHETATAEVPTWSNLQGRIGDVCGRYVEPSVRTQN